MGEERAATMMELMPPVGAEELVTKAYLDVKLAEMRTDMVEMRADLVRSLGTLIIASQAAVIAAVGVFTALA